jgi:hypothetical protein
MHPGLLDVDGEATTSTWKWVPLGVLALGALFGIAAAFDPRRQSGLIRFLQGWAGRIVIVATVAAVLVVGIPELLEWLRQAPEDGGGEVRATKGDGVAIGLGSAATIVVTALLQLRARLADARVLRDIADPEAKGAAAFVRNRVWPRVRTGLILAAAAAAGPVLLGLIVVAAAVLALAYREPLGLIAIVAGTASIAAAFVVWTDVTSWSLHPFYKARLKSAFSLRRITRSGGGDDGDVVIAEPRPAGSELPLSESSVDVEPGGDPQREWPLLLVCAAANVSDPGATPPGRAVTSFTFSPQTIGGPLIGGVPTSEYQQAVGDRIRDVTLPAAVAVSGAALSPSMGKLTRWPFRFLLTLANVRLGVWLPNPRRITECKEERERAVIGARWRPGPTLLFCELIGLNRLRSRFLYVTDGGHYENLGLVELLRRGCLNVYCFDASGGRDTQELGDAISLARSELQVEIDIDPDDLEPDAKTGIAKDCVKVGEIHYPTGETGNLVYVRSVLTEDAAVPHDVWSYHELDTEFPHNSTGDHGDQLYTDQRFEAYRALGTAAAKRALELWNPHREDDDADDVEAVAEAFAQLVTTTAISTLLTGTSGHDG